MDNRPTQEMLNAEQLAKLGRRLRQIRKEQGFKTAEDAANKFEIQRSQYTRYESGKFNINYLTLVYVLSKMNISITEFFSEGFD